MEKKFLNVREIAGRLGVSEKTIYNMVRAGRLPHLRIGGQYRFSIEEVDRALRQPAAGLTARDKLHAAKSILERRLLFVALLTKELEPKGIRPILVGGNAVEFYTAGGYATAGIDLVAPTEPIDSVLISWGFKKDGRFWFDDALGIAVEAPGSALAGDLGHILAVDINDLTCYVIGIEDIVVDRLNAAVHWKSEDDRFWAKELLEIHQATIDWPYLERRSRAEGTEALLKRLRKDLA